MAQFKKGISGNISGRPPGAENKTTILIKEMVTKLVSEGMDQAIDKLKEIEDPKEYLNTLSKFISYVLPKHEIKDNTQPINLHFDKSLKDT